MVTTQSIYAETVNQIKVSDVLLHVIASNNDPFRIFEVHEDWVARLENTLKVLDFNDYNYEKYDGVIISGILSSEPFDSLLSKYGTEANILNIIKENHFHFISTDYAIELAFYNPESSPLYNFFNQYKEDGCELNIPYVLNLLVKNIEDYLSQELVYNFNDFGNWTPKEQDDFLY